MNLGEMNDLLRYISNKTQGGNLPPNRFQDIMNMASRALLNDYLPPRDKRNTKNAYEETQKITDDIYPFKSDPIDLFVDDDGKAIYPPDYVMCSSIRKVLTYNENLPKPLRREHPINVLDDDAIGNILTSRIVGPKLSKPYCTMYNNYIQFWPKNIQVVKFTYIKEPVKIIYATTMVNNRPVYDPANSTETEWPVITHNMLILKALGIMGINLREDQLINNIDKQKQEGV